MSLAFGLCCWNEAFRKTVDLRKRKLASYIGNASCAKIAWLHAKKEEDPLD